MNDYRIIYTPRARSDLLDISTYITYVLSEPDISRNLLQSLHQSITKLSFFPYMFPLVQDTILHNKAIRHMPYKNYSIYYEVIEIMHIVIIHRIVYNKRDPRNL